MNRKETNRGWLKSGPNGDPGRERSGAEFIAETVKGYGITHVFYMDAVLRRALIEMQALGVQTILTHSEKAAAYMADGYARASGRPGLCMAQSVGAANLAAGLQDAFLGHSPVLAITGRKLPLFQYRHAYQEIEHDTIFGPVTKFHANIVDAEQLPFLLRQAFREATSLTPGPVHLDVFGNLGDEITLSRGHFPVLIEEPFMRRPSLRPRPQDSHVQAALHFLRESKKPVIVAGGGAIASGAQAEIVQLAEMLSMPVATSADGKGTILENHPLSVGVVGSYSRRCANQVVSEADLVFFIGSQTGDQVSYDWRIPKRGTPVIQLDVDPRELGRNYPNTVGLMGDARATVRMLIDALPEPVKKDSWIQRAQSIVEAWAAEMEPLARSDAVPIRPERLCRELTEHLPHDALLVADTGHSAIWTGTLVQILDARQDYMRAAGSLGWGFPAALGAECAAPERPVACFTGDGGFWYHLSELETAKRYGINTVTVVNNNHGIGQCVPGIRRAYGERVGDQKGMYRFGLTDLAQVARDMGCQGIRVERPDEIAGALDEAFTLDAPVVVEVITDLHCAAPKPWMQA